MNHQTSTLSPQQALKRLLQADKAAETDLRQAEDRAEQMLKDAREEAERLAEEIRAEAKAKAEEIIRHSQAEAEAQRASWLQEQGAGANRHQAYLADVEAMRQQAERSLEDTVNLLLAWVTGKEA